MPAAKKSQWKVEICIPDAMCSDVVARLKAWGVAAQAWPCTVVTNALIDGVIDGVLVNVVLGKHTEREAAQYTEWVVTNFTTWYRKSNIQVTCTPTRIVQADLTTQSFKG